MRRSLTRIRTSHVGRLPPPKGWADTGALAGAEITDPVVIAAKVTPAIAETVKKQIEAGIDCIGDGEFWTARNLAHYAAYFHGCRGAPGGAAGGRWLRPQTHTGERHALTLTGDDFRKGDRLVVLIVVAVFLVFALTTVCITVLVAGVVNVDSDASIVAAANQ